MIGVIFYSHTVQTIFLPSIFSDQEIARRVDAQRRLERQVFLCKKEQPLVFLYFFKTMARQNQNAWQEYIQKFSNTQNACDRQKNLEQMAAWMIQNIKPVTLQKKLDDFIEQQEQKIIWLLKHGIHVPEYQRKVIRSIEQFKKFKVKNFDNS